MLSGGLIQQFEEYCKAQNISLLIVVDESFRELLSGFFSESSLFYYPRTRLNKGSLYYKISLYLNILKTLRSFKADIAFNIEEDSPAHWLTLYSGAKFRLGCSKHRHGAPYEHVLPIEFQARSKGNEHRWFSYAEVFEALGMKPKSPSYIQLARQKISSDLKDKLIVKGVDFSRPIIAIHAGASKEYKKWSELNFIELSKDILRNGMQPVFIGAGGSDREINQSILVQLKKLDGSVTAVDLCNQLSLVELAEFLSEAKIMIGNDSGPFHLAAALGLPGCVLFGPTNQFIWGPLGSASHVIKGTQPCLPMCVKGQCVSKFHCMNDIKAEVVMSKVLEILADC